MNHRCFHASKNKTAREARNINREEKAESFCYIFRVLSRFSVSRLCKVDSEALENDFVFDSRRYLVGVRVVDMEF
jgi:hypothetical protein